MNKKLTKIVGATLGLAMAVGVGVGFSNNSKVTRLYADNDISISENTTGTSYSGTFFDISAGGATNSGYYKLGSATFTSKSSYSIDSTKSISYSITTRKFGGPSSAEAVVNLSLVNGSNTVATASYSPSSTTLTAYSGTFSVTGDTSSVKFVIKGNGTDTGSKGVGISAISFTATSAGGAVITKYSVTYHANNSDGGTVPSDDGEYLTGDSVVVAGNSGSLVRTGYTWAGWSLNEDGSGTAYGPAYTSNYAVSVGDVDFYPIWKAPLPSSGTISITGSHPTIGSYGDDVPYLVEEDNTPNSSFAFKCTQVMKNNDDLQFKKTDGVLYSTTPLPYLRSVSVSGTNNGDAVIKYGTSPDSGCTQDSIGTRNTFFKIANSASQARYWTITIVYSLEDPASLTDIVITDGADSVKKVYDDGEAFDPTGLVIKAKWGDVLDEDNDISGNVVWTPAQLTVGTTSVTGTYTFGLDSATVTISGLTVTGADFVLDGNSNTPAGVGDDTSVTTGGEGKVNSTGVTYQYLALAVNDYNSVRNLEFNKNVSNAYIGNKESYGKYIRRIKLVLTSDNFNKFTMYKGDSLIPGETSVSPSGTGYTRFYDFNDDSAFFALKLSTTGTWVNISKIEIFLGSDIPTIDTVVASVKSGTYYAGAALSASDFDVTVNWTCGKEATHPTEGFTWTVNGVENGLLDEKSNNKVIVTYEGIESNEFDVAGVRASVKETIENNVSTLSSLKFNYTENYLTDTLNYSFTEITGSSGYKDWSGKVGTSGVVYAGQSNANNNDYIQLRNTSPSGIVTTTSSKYAKALVVVWNSSTNSGRTINIYGKDTAYDSTADLYSSDSDVQGELIGSASYDGSTIRVNVTLSKTHKFIGIKANGALYLDSVQIDWASAADVNNKYTFDNVSIRFGGLISEQLWNDLDSESDIEGYGVLVAATNDLGGKTIKERYADEIDGGKSRDQAISAICNTYSIGKKILDKEHPASATAAQKEYLGVEGNYYIWTVQKPVAAFNTSYSSVAFILIDGDIVFLKETASSAKDIADVELSRANPSEPARPALSFMKEN